jgi:hypothetical protein
MSSHPTTNGRRSSRIARITLVVALVVAIGIAVAVGIAVWGNVTGTLSFNSTVWKRDSFQAYAQKKIDRESATRDRMVEDLLKLYRLKGLRKREVTALLGDPDFRNESPFKDWDMIYWLGPDSRFFGRASGLDFMWLVLKVDSAERVTDFKVTFD